MQIFIDTNIIIDVLSRREDFYTTSLHIFKECEAKHHIGSISALSLANIMYICRKELEKAQLKQAIQSLMQIFNVTELGSKEISKALDLPFNDYEDALQSLSAEKANAEYIITRNVKDFKNSKIKALTPEEFYKIM